MSVGCFIRTKLLTSLWISYPTASSTRLLVGPLCHHYRRLPANCLPLVAIVIKKEEFPIVVPLHTSADEEIKSEEWSPLPSLQYPSTSSSSRPSSRLSSYHTRSPPHRFSPYRRGELSDSTYHLASIIRLPIPLAQPVDCRPVYNHRVTTDTTLIPSSSSAETCVGLIDNALCRIFLPSEVEDLIREGIQLGIQQRVEEEHRQQIWQRVLEARARIEERLNREERILPSHPPFPNLVPCCWFRGASPHPFLCNRIAPLQPRELLGLPAHYHEDYICHHPHHT